MRHLVSDRSGPEADAEFEGRETEYDGAG